MEKYPLTNIHPKAKIAENVIVESFSTIYADVEIGEGTWIGPNVTIFDGARIGKNCKIFPGAVISAIPQDLKFGGEITTTEIGDNTIIRECVTINRGTVDRNKTVVGSNTLLMAYVHVAHDCIIGNNVVLANCVNVAGHVIIQDYVVIEGVVGLQQFVKVGQHAFIAAGSNVRKSVPPYVKAAREPLSYAGVNSVGLRRRGFNNETILQIEDIYRSLYVRGLNVSNALSVIEKEAPNSPEKKIILDFIKEADKGIIRGPIV
ncbi:MAG: acyl-ACP--UDP-N-acetylglucosamine O-acyltransferase [Bacteroidetes bacterium]|nr:acyl-ACP--UDP-N-acetylglucosamine O-acyltransferase [Bacteroidota bacterium]MBV6462465.1 Acyl-[acyl-carrier-protein]--UDP-N-acetylglucosamine O-acyltransferase [Flavobacteriales bacterium]WKZ74368.1 MAG: acyl-ACP--UDP-N-acetylglucosamine O-acyltransferase [Vicingaceae bacterium]MCL4817011.1 acyl-ACP--UDP-N-acetylglucosamine O-acyltransferase [Flavobacteriales bacterium]NOG94690.1 acyl-ACP--UDP-N-acetylglucosamine O-acyltransferase [Bacteroidota bacterium]